MLRPAVGNRLSAGLARGRPADQWVPPYELPQPGEIDIISTSWLANALAPHAGNYPASFNWSYSLFNSFGVGVLVEDYSVGGAFVWAGCGGHDHPDITGAVLVDFTDLTGAWLPHTNNGPQFSSYTNSYGFRDSEDTGPPWREIVGSVNGNEAVPRPGHPYQQLVPVPTSLGGGSRGSVMYVGRAGIGEGGQLSSQRIHRFDLDTRRWVRQTDSALARADYEGSVTFDPARQRYWHTCAGGNFTQLNYQNVEYLDAADWTVKYTPNYSGYPDEDVGDGAARSLMVGGLLILQGANNKLFAFDPDLPADGFIGLTVSGTLGSRYNRLVYYPPTGRCYSISQSGGNMVRVTPPSNLKTGTWTVDTVTLNASLPPVDTSGDPFNQSDQYGLLFYVPSIQRLAWIPSGSTICLLNPT